MPYFINKFDRTVFHREKNKIVDKICNHGSYYLRLILLSYFLSMFNGESICL